MIGKKFIAPKKKKKRKIMVQTLIKITHIMWCESTFKTQAQETESKAYLTFSLSFSYLFNAY